MPSRRSEPPARTHPLLPQFPLPSVSLLPQFPLSCLFPPLLLSNAPSGLSFPSCLAGWIWGIPKGFPAWEWEHTELCVNPCVFVAEECRMRAHPLPPGCCPGRDAGMQAYKDAGMQDWSPPPSSRDAGFEPNPSETLPEAGAEATPHVGRVQGTPTPSPAASSPFAGGGMPPLILLGCAPEQLARPARPLPILPPSLPTGAPRPPPRRGWAGGSGLPAAGSAPPSPSPSPGAGPGALINYLIFPLCLIYSPARLWPYAAFVVSGSLLWQAAGAGETPPHPTPTPPAFDPPSPRSATLQPPPRHGGEPRRGGKCLFLGY